MYNAWYSSSTVLHTMHNRRSRGILGLLCLPVSMYNGCDESLHLVIIFLLSSLAKAEYRKIFESGIPINDLYLVHIDWGEFNSSSRFCFRSFIPFSDSKSLK